MSARVARELLLPRPKDRALITLPPLLPLRFIVVVVVVVVVVLVVLVVGEGGGKHLAKGDTDREGTFSHNAIAITRNTRSNVKDGLKSDERNAGNEKDERFGESCEISVY